MDDNSPVKIELDEQSDKLYILFGGINGRVMMPPFEFYKTSQILNENKIFIRDLHQGWYHLGLPGVGKTIDSIADFLNQQIETIKPKQIFFVGGSMGGFASILFSTKIKSSSTVIAFAPQTFIDPKQRRIHNDKRWKKRLRKMYLRSLFKPKIWDLKNALLASEQPHNIKLFVAKDDELDRVHANHIADIEGVRIFDQFEGGHTIARTLRDQGKLAHVLRGDYP